MGQDAPGEASRTAVSGARYWSGLAGAMGLLLAASGWGWLANALSVRPLALWDPQGPGAVPPRAERLNASRVAQAWRSGKLAVMDARTDALRNEAPIPGALACQPEKLPARYGELGPFLRAAEAIVIVCDTPHCSAGDRLAKKLAELGHPGAWVFEGAWPAWRAAGLPVETVGARK